MYTEPSDVLHLNVGGQRYSTSRKTVEANAPALLIAYDRLAEQGSELHIDRDPKHFATILNFLRDGRCQLPSSISELLQLRDEAIRYEVHALLESIDSCASMRVHRKLAGAARSRELLRAAADALLAYAFGRDDAMETDAWPGMMADVVQVDVRVALSTTASVQGRYDCRLEAHIAGPAAVKQLRQEYKAAGPLESPLAAPSNLASPFYHELNDSQKAVWDEIRFLRKNADAIAYLVRQDSCFRVALELLKPEPPAAEPEARAHWRPAFDTTLRFEVKLV